MDVYSFSMIAYSLFEHCQPFAGMDPVEAARQSALYDKRPQLMKLGGKSPNMQARPSHRVQGVLCEQYPACRHRPGCMAASCNGVLDMSDGNPVCKSMPGVEHFSCAYP